VAEGAFDKDAEGEAAVGSTGTGEAPGTDGLRTAPARGTASTVVPLLTVALDAGTDGVGSAATSDEGDAPSVLFEADPLAKPDDEAEVETGGLESDAPPKSLIPSREAPPPKKNAMTTSPTTTRMVQVSQFPGPLEENPSTPRLGMG
jgi:hypothetical protein